MLIRTDSSRNIPASEITPEALFNQRRRFIKGGAALGIGLGAGLTLTACDAQTSATGDVSGGGDSTEKALPDYKAKAITVDEELTPFKDITSYNNFYEFGLDKSDPAAHAHTLQTRPWQIKVDGQCEAPGSLGIEDILSSFALEERIYRLRCVEAWSMVVPWIGFPLGDLLKRFKPLSSAKYVYFETLVDKQQMPGQRRNSLDWPYREGLRMDEAMHPLTILAVGLYGKQMPKQNGAPIRLVVPWKYGFKSIKSIVSIRFTEQQPPTTWNMQAPNEYGFYSNVNPEVSHPRWSQARERRIGEFTKRRTLMFNGYEEQVASLYAGMDLRKHF